ncbi:MAG TPA: hypothetical protein VGM30_17530 [Puia sp.]|jgi:hypothetical protein
MAIPPPTPVCIIPAALAEARIKYFMDNKKPILDGMIAYKPEIEKITYSPSVFLQLLGILMKTPGKYSGVRVYFGSYLWSDTDPGIKYIPAGMEENLVLLFVPTIADGSTGNIVHKDDTTSIYAISFNQLVLLPDPSNTIPAKDTASNWIRHFQSKIPSLNMKAIRTTGNAAFDETRSNWYKIENFIDTDPNCIGLATFIQTLQKAGNLVCIDTHPACYTPKDSFDEAKLTLVFVLKSSNKLDSTNYFFGTNNTNFDINGFVKDPFDDDPGADTGLPCPPDDGCINGGSLLPQP